MQDIKDHLAFAGIQSELGLASFLKGAQLSKERSSAYRIDASTYIRPKHNAAIFNIGFLSSNIADAFFQPALQFISEISTR